MLPTQVLSKLIFFILGFLFWHVVPVMCSLAPSDIARSVGWYQRWTYSYCLPTRRLPPAFSDVPTDVEYAMALISQRVAAGLEIKPIKRDSLNQRSTIVDSLLNENARASETQIDWKRWGNRIALGKSTVSAITRLNPVRRYYLKEALVFWRLKEGGWAPPINCWNSQSVSLKSVLFFLATDCCVAYPCQHHSAPGLITLTQDTMSFTPLLRQDAKIIIALTAIKGVKKVGMLKGLQVRWNDASGDKEDRFLWIGERDDLFARLVGSDGKRWIQIWTIMYNYSWLAELCNLPHLSLLASMFFTPELLTRRDSGFGLLWYVGRSSFFFLSTGFR